MADSNTPLTSEEMDALIRKRSNERAQEALKTLEDLDQKKDQVFKNLQLYHQGAKDVLILKIKKAGQQGTNLGKLRFIEPDQNKLAGLLKEMKEAKLIVRKENHPGLKTAGTTIYATEFAPDLYAGPSAGEAVIK